MDSLRKYLSKLDKDQKDVLRSTFWIIAISVAIAAIIPWSIVFTVLPLQYFITTRFARPVKLISKPKARPKMFKDLTSGKVFEGRFPLVFWTLIGSGLVLIFALGAPSKANPFEFWFMFIPLLLSRAYVFFNKLPLTALYVGSDPKTYNRRNTLAYRMSYSSAYKNSVGNIWRH